MTYSAEARLLNIVERLSTLPLLQLPADIELSRPAIALLSRIATFPGSGVVDLADGLGLSPPTISVGIRRLAKGGWLERYKDPDDGRSRLVYLTPKGDELMDRLRRHQMEMFNVFLSPLTKEEQDTLLDLLERALETGVDLLEEDHG